MGRGHITSTASGGGSGPSGDTLPVIDTKDIVKGVLDATKRLRFNVSGFLTGHRTTLIPQDVDDSYMIAGTDIENEFLENQTFGRAIISNAIGSDDNDVVFEKNSLSSFGFTLTGDNANFRFDRYDDDGEFVDSPWSVGRSDGKLTLDTTILHSRADGVAVSHQYLQDGLKRFAINIIEDGSAFQIQRYDDDGDLVDEPFQIARSTGGIFLAGDMETRGMVPATALTHDVGGASNRYRTGYFQDVNISGGVVSSLGSAGVEFAPLVGSLVATINYDVDNSGDQLYQISCTWVDPSGAGSEKFGGLALWYRPPGGDGTTDVPLGKLDQGTQHFDSPFFASPSEVESGKVYGLSYNQFNETNTYLFGTTPEDDTTIQPQIGTTGHEYAPDVTGLSVVVTYYADAAGGYNARLVMSFTAPSDPTFGGVDWVIRDPDGVYHDVGIFYKSGIQFRTPAPDSVESWVCLAVGCDTNSNVNRYLSDPDNPVSTPLSSTPKVTVSVGDASGKLNFGKGNALTLAAQLRINSGLLGVAPSGITTTEVRDDSITTPKLTTSEISIGGAGAGKPIRFRIYDHSGNPIGWIGDDLAISGFVGAWFKQLYIGGTGPAGAPFQVDSQGRMSISIVQGTVNGDAFNLTINNVNTKIANIYSGGSLPGSVQYIGLKVTDTNTNRFSAITPTIIATTANPTGGGPCAALSLAVNGSGYLTLIGSDLVARVDVNADPTNPFFVSIAGTVSAQIHKTLLGPDYIYSVRGDGHTMWALGQTGNAGLIRITDGGNTGGFDGIGSRILGTGADGILKATRMVSLQFSYWNGSAEEPGVFTSAVIPASFGIFNLQVVQSISVTPVRDPGTGFLTNVIVNAPLVSLAGLVQVNPLNQFRTLTFKGGLLTSS